MKLYEVTRLDSDAKALVLAIDEETAVRALGWQTVPDVRFSILEENVLSHVVSMTPSSKSRWVISPLSARN